MIDPVPVLCFRAGGVGFAVDATAVRGLRDDDGQAPPIAVSLGLREQRGGGGRIVTLASAAGVADAVIHGPIVVCHLTVEQIVAPPRGVRLDPTVLGFARVGDELFQLLAVERVIACLTAPGAS